MTTLAVGGCSYSDRLETDKVYGDFICEQLGYDYLHLAKSSGSNYRTWYKLTRAILDKKILENDIIILQYTEPHRKILPSIEPLDSDRANEPGRVEMHDLLSTHNKGYSTDYKINSHIWQAELQNKKLHQTMDECSNNYDFDYDMMIAYHKMFEALCGFNKINLITLITRYLDSSNLLRHSNKNTVNLAFNETMALCRGSASDPHEHDMGWDSNLQVEYDSTHLSIIGHKKLAQGLINHIKEKIYDYR